MVKSTRYNYQIIKRNWIMKKTVSSKKIVFNSVLHVVFPFNARCRDVN